MYLITYDISNDKRLKKIAKTLKRYGRRVQKSVFECNITEKKYLKLRGILEKQTAEGDHVSAYTLPPDSVKDFRISDLIACKSDVY